MLAEEVKNEGYKGVSFRNDERSTKNCGKLSLEEKNHLMSGSLVELTKISMEQMGEMAQVMVGTSDGDDADQNHYNSVPYAAGVCRI